MRRLLCLLLGHRWPKFPQIQTSIMDRWSCDRCHSTWTSIGGYPPRRRWR